MPRKIAVIGGGAAGFFAAITAAEAAPGAEVVLYEKGRSFLTKVKISGGGRCNTTHACFDPAELVKFYPRGSKELRGAFHRWQPQDTIDWFAENGVTLKTEADGRMFPDTDSSQTIIDCFHEKARKLGVQLRLSTGVRDIQLLPDDHFQLTLSDDSISLVDQICLTSGSLKSSQLTRAVESLGHSIKELVPSLFAFDITDPRLTELAGLSVQQVSIKLTGTNRAQLGPILITHRGVSGPAVLRLSAWEAREFHEADYQKTISINWLGNTRAADLQQDFKKLREQFGKRLVKTNVPDAIPRRLWERLLSYCEIEPTTQWSQLSKSKENALVSQLTDCQLQVKGKTTNKDEFVTCGGIHLKEVDFRTMESRLVPNLYFAGECLNIDGITGGFNFQAAWTTAHIAGAAMAT